MTEAMEVGRGCRWLINVGGGEDLCMFCVGVMAV